jgi:hypothetical protein
MPPAARSVEELFPLIEFCKAGDLKATSDWIAKGNPLDLPPGKKTRRASPLQIAIEKGFLSLTETRRRSRSICQRKRALGRGPLQADRHCPAFIGPRSSG